jgi:peptidoglycan glycosyltransferase
VTKPGFNPNRIDEEWQSISTSPDSPLLNRAVQGLYPPGSTMKVLTAEAALFENITDTKKTYQSDGMLKIPPDYVLHEVNDKAYGTLNLKQALTVSSNVVFGKITLELGGSKLAKAYERFGFQKPLDVSIGENMSHIPDFSQLSNGDLAQSGIGQASLLVTPLRMAMLAATIANKGKTMEPYLINKIVDGQGNVIKQYSPQEWLTASTPEIAAIVKQMMVSVVDNGTGRGNSCCW